MTLVFDDNKVRKKAESIFIDRVVQDNCLDLWRNNLMSDQDLIYKLTRLNIGCTKTAIDEVAKEIKDEHETHPGAAT